MLPVHGRLIAFHVLKGQLQQIKLETVFGINYLFLSIDYYKRYLIAIEGH